MSERSYTDFDLVIEQVGDKYRARVIDSPAGQAQIEFDSLFSPLELENFVLKMGRPQKGMRRIESSEMQTVKTFGTRLFRTVFSDDVLACYLRSLDQVLNQDKGLRIRLRINVPQFNDLPWEFMYNPQVDQFLALSMNTPIIRYIELPYASRPLPVKTPMNILVMISSPQEYPPLDVEQEWKRLSLALQPMIDRGQVTLQRLAVPTLSALQQHLRLNKVHVFHFIGHGKYFEQQQDGMLLLEDENGRGAPTSGQHLGAILHDHNSLRLVVLNACEGARTSAEDPYTGVAQTLVRQGIPAVLANQFEIFEQAAITLAQEFYRAIADGLPVDAALSEARKAIFASNNDVEWGTPVLFMRIPDGVIFRPQKSSERPPRRAPEKTLPLEPAPPAAQPAQPPDQKVETYLAQGRALIEKQDWPAAALLLQELVDLAPGHQEAAQLLLTAQVQLEKQQKEAQLQAKAEAIYSQARAKLAAQDWVAAINLMHELESTYPGYRDAKDLLSDTLAAQARREDFARLVKGGVDLLSSRSWTAAASNFKAALQLDPSDLDVQALLARAEKGELIDSLYARGREEMSAKKWVDAVATFQELLTIDPSHAGAQLKVLEAREGMARSSPPTTIKMEKQQPPRPGSLPEEIKPRGKPSDLPR
jgi:tetratricopeptide (TPR) repeat protein